MALKKIRPNNTVIGIIIGLLVTANIGLTGMVAVQNNQIKGIELINEKNIEEMKDILSSVIEDNKDLQERLSAKTNSQSDIRVIRPDLIEKIKEIGNERKKDIQEMDILRALKSSENRVMEEYIRIASLVLATMEIESNFKYITNENNNGTKDYGIMQVNDVIIPHMKEALGEELDPINSKDDNVEGGSYEIYECYLKAKEKHPENVIWWTYAYYNRGLYFENTDAWKDPSNPAYEKTHKQANIRSEKFISIFNAYYEALIALI